MYRLCVLTPCVPQLGACYITSMTSKSQGGQKASNGASGRVRIPFYIRPLRTFHNLSLILLRSVWPQMAKVNKRSLNCAYLLKNTLMIFQRLAPLGVLFTAQSFFWMTKRPEQPMFLNCVAKLFFSSSFTIFCCGQVLHLRDEWSIVWILVKPMPTHYNTHGWHATLQFCRDPTTGCLQIRRPLTTDPISENDSHTYRFKTFLPITARVRAGHSCHKFIEQDIV